MSVISILQGELNEYQRLISINWRDESHYLEHQPGDEQERIPEETEEARCYWYWQLLRRSPPFIEAWHNARGENADLRYAYRRIVDPFSGKDNEGEGPYTSAQVPEPFRNEHFYLFTPLGRLFYLHHIILVGNAPELTNPKPPNRVQLAHPIAAHLSRRMFHWDEEAQKYCVNRTEATEVDHLDHKRLNISVNLRYPTSRIMNDIEEILNLLREERSGGGEALHNEITGKKYTLKTKSPSYSHLMEQAQVPERGEHRDQEFALGSNPFSIKTLVRLYDAMLIKRMAPRDFTHQDILEVLDPNHCILSETDNWIKKKMKQVMPLINDPESFLLRTPPKESF